MISNQELEQKLSVMPEVTVAQVTGDLHHYYITLVSDAFMGLSKLSRQKWVYAKLDTYIRSGALHAVHMKTFTTLEWETQHG